MQMNLIKRCNKCKDEKLVGEFPKNRRLRSGVDGWCKECHRKASVEHYDLNKERIKGKVKKWQEENPELVNQYRRDYRERKCKDTTLKKQEPFEEKKCDNP
jgi:hypothetical protein